MYYNFFYCCKLDTWYMSRTIKMWVGGRKGNQPYKNPAKNNHEQTKYVSPGNGINAPGQ